MTFIGFVVVVALMLTILNGGLIGVAAKTVAFITKIAEELSHKKKGEDPYQKGTTT